ncbi:MAG: AAA family ATPase, partial [Bacteroidales bacterium]|nr:AAA family ATPase [Bacteroidales bacterium]
MRRTIYNQLLTWKNTPDGLRKPLILEGARQTGKTWLARELGLNEFENFVEINFERIEEAR